MENYNGVYWYVMDYIGGMIILSDNAQTHYKMEFCNGLLEKANGLYWHLMETIDSIGLLLFS